MIESNANILADEMERIPSRLFTGLKTSLDLFLSDFLTRFKTARLSGRPGLNIQSGRLRESFTHSISGEGEDIQAIAGSDIEYAIYHELGTESLPPRLRFFSSFDEDLPILDDMLEDINLFNEID